jgi:hypothetical protein
VGEKTIDDARQPLIQQMTEARSALG